MWPFGRKKEETPQTAAPNPAPTRTVDADESVLGKGIRVQGDLTSKGDLALAGAIEGVVTVRGFSVAAGGRLKGRAEVNSAEIRGTLEGSLSVKGLTRIHAEARMEGDLATSSLMVADRAQLEGRVVASGAGKG